MSKKAAYLSILSGAALWGIIGFFANHLYALGFSSVQVVAVRNLTSALFLVIYLFIKDRRLLKIRVRDFKYFIGTGIISIALFNLCMFQTIQETSISIAAVLLYTAPAFVAVLSRLLFKETLTPLKITALFVTLAGCAFVVGLLPDFKGTISPQGLLLGLGSGFFYALYSIFGKYALKKYDTLTVTTYTFLFAAVAVTPFSGVRDMAPLFLSPQALLYIVGLSLFSTVLAFVLYTKGLTVVESSRASIIATIEPVVAAFTGFLVFGERLQLWQYFGIALVLASIILVQEIPGGKKGTTSETGLAEKKKAAV